MNLRRPAVLLLTVLMLAGVAVFGVQQVRQAGAGLVKVWKVAGQPGLWRSANFSQNRKFADGVRFLLENIPPDRRVVLPAAGQGSWAFTNTAFMQFFLSPRPVVNCAAGDAPCVTGLVEGGAYLVVLDPAQVPGELVSANPNRLVMFTPSLGVLRPEAAPPADPAALPPAGSWLDILLAALGPLLWLAWLAAAGWLFLRGLSVPLASLSRLALGFGLAAGALTWLVFLALWAGLPLTPGLCYAAAGLVMLIAAGVYAFGRVNGRAMPVERTPYTRQDLWWILALLAWGGVMAVLAAGKGFHITDSVVLWGVKGYGIAAAGLAQAATEWGTRTSEYPLNLPIWIAVNKVLFTDALPGSLLIYPALYLGLLYLMADFLRRRLPVFMAALAVLVFAFTPLIARHAAIAYANLPLTFYLAAAAMLAVDAFQTGERAIQKRMLLLAGLCAALAAWTRPEALWMSGLFVLWAAGWVAWNTTSGGRLRLALPVVLPPLVLVLTWLVARPDVYLRPMREASIRQAALQGVAAGEMHWEGMTSVVKYLLVQVIDTGTWGILILAALLLLAFGLAIKSHSRPGWALLVLSLGLILPFLGVYWIASYDVVSDLQWWLDTGFNRMLMPGITILWLAAWLACSEFFTKNIAERSDKDNIKA